MNFNQHDLRKRGARILAVFRRSSGRTSNDPLADECELFVLSELACELLLVVVEHLPQVVQLLDTLRRDRIPLLTQVRPTGTVSVEYYGFYVCG